jgi:hypothetical protein
MHLVSNKNYLMPGRHGFGIAERKGEGQCQSNWKERLHSLRAARGALELPLLTKRLAADGADVAITYTKGVDAAASVVKEIERSGQRAIAIQADAADADAGRPRSKRPSRLSAALMCL